MKNEKKGIKEKQTEEGEGEEEEKLRKRNFRAHCYRTTMQQEIDSVVVILLS